MNATRKPGLGTTVGLLTVLLATSALAAPIVVGSVHPVTHQVTIFQDMLVTTFADGTPIQHLYGRFDAVTREFLLVRTGKMAAGDCRTEALRLLRLSGNRLALATNTVSSVPWNGTGTIRLLKLCFKGTCQGSCQVLGNPETPLDLQDYLCWCSNAGACDVAFPEVVTLDELVVQNE